jgi:Xaa-Pro aminopeptidase
MTFDPKNANASRQAHDTAAPHNLIQFMLKDWRKPTAAAPKAVKNVAHHRARRDALSKLFPGETLIIPTGRRKVRANDTHYAFRPGSDFFYLTGCWEPDCVLILEPRTNGHDTILFVEPNAGKTDPSFFTDRVKGELWEGPRPTVEQASSLYGIKNTQGLPELGATLKRLLTPGSKWRAVRGFDSVLESQLNITGPGQWTRDQELTVALSEMRLYKDAAEVKEIQAAIDATQKGFEDVIRRLKTAKSERELEGVFWTRARMEGNDVGYGSIVASGEHACTLHWKKNDGRINKGDLLLLDAGIEGHSLYTADITRTMPVSGKFTKEQKAIYELVLAAQVAALKQVKPGNDFMAPNEAAMAVLAQGLVKLGILKCTAEEALKAENQFYKRYSLHNVSHMLGIDVHDCAAARAEAYKFGKLKAGMVLTVEPGLYFQPDDLTVAAKYRGIGVRIEDDVVVTATGCKVLSSRIPKKPADLERWMKKLWSTKK